MSDREKVEHQKQLIFGYLKQIQALETEKKRYELLYKNYKERYVKMLEGFLDLLNLQKEFFDYKQPSVLKKCKREEAQLKFVIETRLKQEKELEAQHQ